MQERGVDFPPAKLALSLLMLPELGRVRDKSPSDHVDEKRAFVGKKSQKYGHYLQLIPP